MRIDTAGCVVLSLSAAPRKLRNVATHMKVSMVLKSIMRLSRAGVLIRKAYQSPSKSTIGQHQEPMLRSGVETRERADARNRHCIADRPRGPAGQPLRRLRRRNVRPRARLRAGQPGNPPARLGGRFPALLPGQPETV